MSYIDQPWYIIVNPSAGCGRAKKRWTSIKKELERQEIVYDFRISREPHEIAELVPELIANGLRRFVSVGGDGTLHQLINAIFSQDVVASKEFIVGIIPVGTGNDWIKSHGISSELHASVKVIKQGCTIRQNIGVIQSGNMRRCFVNMVGLGLTPFVVRQYSSWGHRLNLGSLGYLVTTAVSLLKYREEQYQVSNGNGLKFNGRLLTLNIGLGQYCGGGIRLVPQAQANGHKLQCTVVHPIALWNILANLAKLFNGKILSHPKVDSYEASILTVAAEKPFYLEADGELIRNANSFTISMIPEAISILVPETETV
ncbi:MAG: diacylglycerol/lipid kinase family protein [Cyclobacteriaceae bacterium]